MDKFAVAVLVLVISSSLGFAEHVTPRHLMVNAAIIGMIFIISWFIGNVRK